jgi:HAD superfamily hydrolase (TIGR01509 family)
MIRGLLFDLDGTLFFTEKANFLSYQRAFHEVGFTLEREAYARAFGLRFDAMVKAVGAPLTPAQVEQVRAAKARYYRENLSWVEPNTALIGFLRGLRASHRTGLVTTAARQNAMAILEHFGLVSAFDHAVFGEDVAQPKPHPEGYLTLLRRLDVTPRECVAFEDSETGMAAAEAAGVNVVRIPAS